MKRVTPGNCVRPNIDMPKDLAYEKDLTVDPKKSIRSGFGWLGMASILSQVLDALTMIIAMIFMPKEEIGIATLALSFSVIAESFNALGTNQGVLQAKSLTHEETHSVFWFSAIFGLLTLVILIPLAWPFAAFYKNTALIPLFIIAVFKLPLVSIAAIPEQLINRRLEYRKISTINIFNTLICSLLKIVLAILGFGAWALVIGATAFGLGRVIGAFAYSKYIPQKHFNFAECRRFISFGIKTCLSTAQNQFNKNLHFLVVGKLLGEGVLGIYKMAYELAMSPALALFNVVTKSSFPVFSRLQDKRDELSKLFLWNQKNIALLAAIPTVAILFASKDIFGLMPKSEWMEAIPIIPFVLALSFLRSLMLAYPDLYRACGRPDLPIYTELIETILFLVLCTGAIFRFESFPLEAMICTWIAIHLICLGIHYEISKRFIDNRMIKLITHILPGIGYIILASLLSLPLYIYRDLLPFTNWTHIVAELVIILVSLLFYAKFVLKISIRELLGKK
jgi:O-antigen/teichoic acid export membrane protein